MEFIVIIYKICTILAWSVVASLVFAALKITRKIELKEIGGLNVNR